MAQKNFRDHTIYLDQAATSRPKASGVGYAMRSYIDDVCASINRSTYAVATNAAMRVLETREQLCELFRFRDPTHVIFTPGQTVSLNMVLKGFLRPGDHVLVSSLEHNGVMRPLTQLAGQGVKYRDLVPQVRGHVRRAHISAVSGAQYRHFFDLHCFMPPLGFSFQFHSP